MLFEKWPISTGFTGRFAPDYARHGDTSCRDWIVAIPNLLQNGVAFCFHPQLFLGWLTAFFELRFIRPTYCEIPLVITHK
jgi:hypothetical protein